MSMKQDYFMSSDLGLVVALCSSGFTLDCIDRSSNRATFVLKREEGMDEAIQRYWSHSLPVDALEHFTLLKEIKTRLYQ